MFRLVPLLPIAIGLIVGIALDRGRQPEPVWFLGTLAGLTVLGLVPWVRLRTAPILVIGLAAAAGGLLHWSAARHVQPDSIERHADRDGAFVRLRGRIVSTPQILEPSPNPFAQWIPQSQRTAFVLAVDAIESEGGFIPAGGRVRVTVYEAVLGLRMGQGCEIFGRLIPLSPPANPGSFDWQTYSRIQGVCARLICQHRENLRTASPTDSGGWLGLVSWSRDRITALLRDDFPTDPEDHSGLLESMLLGQRSQASTRLNELFIASGCVHYLSVSGIHLVIVMYLARGLCQLLGLSRNATSWMMMGSVVAYAILAEPYPPILRAAIIAVIYCIARLVGRERSYLNWTSCAAIILLTVNPLWLFDIGFQLSFAAILGVGYLTPAIKHVSALGLEKMRTAFGAQTGSDSDRAIIQRLREQSRERRGFAASAGAWVLTTTRDGLAVSLAAWLAGLPIVAAHFYRIQPWSALNSTLLMAPVTLAMALGIAKIGASAVSPSAGEFFGWMLDRVDALLLHVVGAMAKLPGATITAPFFPWWVYATFFGCLIFVGLRFSNNSFDSVPRPAIIPDRRPILRLPRFTARLSMGVFLIAAVVSTLSHTDEGELRVTFLSVGRGTTTVLELPDGNTILYDAGASYSSDPAISTIVPFLLSRGIHRIDRLYVSHPNLDHFSGVPSLLKEIETGPIVLNSCFEMKSGSNTPSRHFLEQIKDTAHPVNTLQPDQTRWTTGGVYFEVLWPVQCRDEATVNDTSTVLRITYAGRSILLSGDIDEGAQKALLAGGGLTADVLSLPHHGSVRRTTREFLRAVDAQALIRSSDERMQDTLNGLVEIAGDTPLYNTADQGAITVVLSGAGMHISTMHE